jgi:hypothetical protein
MRISSRREQREEEHASSPPLFSLGGMTGDVEQEDQRPAPPLLSRRNDRRMRSHASILYTIIGRGGQFSGEALMSRWRIEAAYSDC